MNNGSGLKFLLIDQPGSVVAVTDNAGTLMSRQRYLPFAQIRTDVASPNPQSGSTDFSYTGQRGVSGGLGLMDYHARMYDSYITQAFIQPDDIIPDYNNPQSLNRYAYVMNRPTVLTDPTGHISCYGPNADDGPQCYQTGKINNLGHNQPMGSKAKTNGCSFDDDKCLLSHRNNGDSSAQPIIPINPTENPPTQSASQNNNSPSCQSCIIEGGALIVLLLPTEIALGAGMVLAAPEPAAPILEVILFMPEAAAADASLIGVELIAQGQHRSPQDVHLDPFPIIPTSSHMFNPDIWK